MNKLFKSKEIDEECRYINEKCLQNCICIKNNDNNIIKKCLDPDLFYWETSIYLALLDKNFIPMASSEFPKIIYHTHNMKSLRSILKSRNCNIKEILNEVFNFVNNFKKYNFIHGNLHIDNIFIDSDNNYYIIDFTNSYYHFIKGGPNYKRRSFIDFQYNDRHIKYLDFFTLYISLKLFFKNKIKYIYYLENLIRNYIKNEILTHMLYLYIK